ncbi:MAG: type IV fimbrial bioproteinis protein FimT [Gallionellaceae bacterium]|nr:MAG: type IV fimbrial bioproteinis protein FimT [Gallionellaceae bacterium]
MKQLEKNKTQRGVTLVELMIVIVIGSILATLAIPSFNEFISGTRQSSVVSQLFSDLNRARSESIKRNARVLVCPRGSDTACDTSGTTNWNSGWLVCTDANSDNACDVGTTANPNPIVVHSALHTTLTLTGPNAAVRFNPSGISGSGAATLTVGGTWSGATSSIINVAGTGNISRP